MNDKIREKRDIKRLQNAAYTAAACILLIVILLIIVASCATVKRAAWIAAGAAGAMVIVLGSAFICLHYFIYPVLKTASLSGSEELYDKLKKLDNRCSIRFILRTIEKCQREFARKQTDELIRKQAEFNELQNQINPHFLYNTLESIRAEALSENAMQIANMVRALSSFYRYSIGRYHTLVTFKDEIDNINNYFAIQRYRFGSRFSLEIDIPPEEEGCLDLYIIKLSIQPIIENAIYHGMEMKKENGHIKITALQTQSRFIITVSDNGVGVAPERLSQINELLNTETEYLSQSYLESSKGTGMGLLNINKRIKMYFGEEYGVIMRSVTNVGTDVEIVLPVVREIG